MAGFSDYAENKVLDHVFGGPDYTRPSNLYLALCTSAPSDSSTGSTIVEPSGGSYARTSITNNSTNFPGASGGSKANGTDITCPTATASWGTITHLALVDASSAGNVIVFGSLTSSKTVDNGDTVSIATGALTIALD